jgi:cytochrome c peroxidase
MKTVLLRRIRDTPPYLHDGRCPMLEDSVGFNLVLGTNPTGDEKKDLVADLRGL